MPLCKLCKDDGYIVTPERKIVPCACFMERRNRKRLDNAGVPRSLQDSRLEHFFPTKDADHKPLNTSEEDMKQLAREVVTAYIEHLPESLGGEMFKHQRAEGGRTKNIQGNTLLLVGSYRSGKSLLATAIARAALIDFSVVAAYIEWPVLVEAFESGPDKIEAMRSLISPSTQVLIVENVRPDVTAEWIKRRIDAGFAERRRLMLPTVFTTSEINLHKMLADGFGPVLGSLLRDSVQLYLPAGKAPGDKEDF